MKIHRILYYLLLFFLPTQLGLHLWPAWSYVLGRRIDYLSPTIYLTDVLIFFILLFWFVESHKRDRNYVLGLPAGKAGIMGVKRRLFPVFFSKIRNTKTIILFFLFAFGNIWVAHNQPVAIYWWIKVVEFFLFFYYIKITKPSFIKSSLVLLLALTYSSSIAIVQFVYQHSLGGIFWLLGERAFTIETPGIARFDWCGLFVSSCRLTLRPYATFPHPNVLAGYIVATFPVFVFLLLKKNKEVPPELKKFTYFFIPIIFFLNLLTLALTFSRSALIVGLIILSVYFIVNKTSNRKIKLVLMLTILSIVLAIIAIGKQLSLSSESVLVRQDLNTNAVALWKSSPLFGVGLKNSIVSLPGVMHTKQVYFLQPIHNIYLLVLAENGIVGVLFFLWIIVKIFDRLRYQYNQKGRIVTLVKILSFASILLLGFVDHYFLTLQQGQLLLTYIAGMSYIDS